MKICKEERKRVLVNKVDCVCLSKGKFKAVQ